MQDVMVDLETLGQVPGCAIMSIGAVAFCPATLEMAPEGFYSIVGRASCEEVFLFEQEDTKSWWQRQSADARVLLDYVEDPTKFVHVKRALELFNRFLEQYGPDVRVWGNGSDFDNAILASAYEAVKMKPYWKFWNNRCFRTIKNLAPEVKVTRLGVYHNALDDAKHQVRHLFSVLGATGIAL